MRNLLILLAVALFTACGTGSKEESSQTAPGAIAEEDIQKGVWFESPSDGETLTSPVTIKMAVGGMEVEPAGMVVEGKGHHHLVIDGSFVEKGIMVPADSTHIHYGKGQTEVQIELAPGAHTLTMQFADGVHTSYGEEWSATININIEESSESTN